MTETAAPATEAPSYTIHYLGMGHFGEAIQVVVCSACGSMVVNWSKHVEWHAKMEAR